MWCIDLLSERIHTMKEKEKEKLGLLGVSVDHLQCVLMSKICQAADLHGIDLTEHSTIYDINKPVIQKLSKDTVCPIDGRMGSAYVHAIHGEDHVGSANIMLSYTWGYTIGDIIDTLLYYCSSNDLDPKATYVWICCLCVNQHRVVDRQSKGETIPFKVFYNTFFGRVTSIGHILVMMAPWDAPTYLTRCWCLFELFMANLHKCKIYIEMPSKQRKEFIQGLTHNGISHVDKLLKTFASTNVSDANASCKTDKDNILKIIRKQEGGYKEFDSTINSLLRDWVSKLIEDTTKTMECDEKDEKVLQHYLHQAGVLLRHVWELDRSLDVLTRNIKLCEKVHGRNDVITAKALTEKATVLWKLENYDASMKLLDRALAIHEEKQDGEVAFTLMHMGIVLVHQCKYGKLNRALKINKEKYDNKKHIFIGNTLRPIAEAYEGQNKLEDALDTYEKVFEIREREFESDGQGDSVRTASVRMRIARVLCKLDRFDEATKHARRGLNIYDKVRGHDSRSTRDAREQLNMIEVKRNNTNSLTLPYPITKSRHIIGRWCFSTN